MVTTGPLVTLMVARERAGVAIADLRIERDAEDGAAADLIVDFLGGGGPEHRAVLTSWASLVGYRRVWFADDIVDLDRQTARRARVRCTGCGTRLVDGGEGFWSYVRRCGRFPIACPLCGCDLPQWEPERQTRVVSSDPAGEDVMRRTACK
jgi:hypothetical protein